MLINIALILLGIYVFMPKAVAVTLITFGAIGCFFNLCSFILKSGKK